MKKLTQAEKAAIRRNEIYNFILTFKRMNGYAPSVRDICKGTGVKSTSTVYSDLKVLMESGKIYYNKSKSRSIKAIGSTEKIVDAASVIKDYCISHECEKCEFHNSSGCMIKNMIWG